MDRVSVAGGAAIALLGALLLLDQTDVLELRFAWAAPAVLAAVGVVLLAAGLDGPRKR